MNEEKILKEISDIATSHGSFALSEMTDKKIRAISGKFETVDLTQKNNKEEYVAASKKIFSRLGCYFFFVCDQKTTVDLVKMCGSKKFLLNKPTPQVFSEIAAIVISAYLSAFEIVLKTPMISSDTELKTGTIFNNFKEALFSLKEPKAICFNVFLEEIEKRVYGKIYMVMDKNTYDILIDSCRKLLPK